MKMRKIVFKRNLNKAVWLM